MVLAVIVAFKLVLLHGPGGQMIEINPDQVVTLREPRADEGHFPKGIRCIVNMTDGKLNVVQEDCSTIRDMIEEAEK
jgi:hypothetical protein